MQAFYIALCLFVLGTSALKCCEHKGPCAREMIKRSLKCDNDAQQQDECSHHDHFSGANVDTLSDEVVKQKCCQVTCYSVFYTKKFTCPAGYGSPSEDHRQQQTVDRSADDLQKECCKKPRVSCYTLFKANKFSCPSTHITPTEKYMNDDIHEDMDSKTAGELQNRCCRQRGLCYAKLTAKNLDCDGLGTMPGMSRRE